MLGESFHKRQDATGNLDYSDLSGNSLHKGSGDADPSCFLLCGSPHVELQLSVT